tara:strand:- start:8241 stop:9161 length:921 start_codon:yes stop_codon:yes gene_type:complete
VAQLIATVSNPEYAFVVIDTVTHELTRVHSSPELLKFESHEDENIAYPHRPFGITWRDGEILICNRKVIWRFDRQYMYLGFLHMGLTPNPQQMVARDGRLWIATPRLNSFTFIGREGRKHFCPITKGGSVVDPPQDVSGSNDINHYTSLLFTNDCAYFLAHNKDHDSGSEILCFGYQNDPLELTYLRSYLMGKKAHGISVDEKNRVATISADDMVLIRSDGLGVEIPTSDNTFARGLALSKDSYYVASFPAHQTIYRGGKADVCIDAFDSETLEYTARWILPDVGAVNDLRLLDEFDYAHYVQPLE